MRTSDRLHTSALVVLVVFTAVVCPVQLRSHSAGVFSQSALTPQETRGKRIYLKGTSSNSQEILAYVGESSMELPGATMACVNCHGFDGKGKPEGGLVPSNLTWQALTKPYEVLQASGRKRAPYTESSLAGAITRGLDPNGNKLLNIMPRYEMSRGDLSDLLAYLKRLGNEAERGISETEITIGVILPGQTLAGMGEAIKAVTNGFFDQVNAQGGIYNRKVNVKFVEVASAPADTTVNVKNFIHDHQIFALTGSFIAGAEKELNDLTKQLEVPLIGPLTLQPQLNKPLNEYVFYTVSGLEGQAAVLLDFALSKSSEKSGVLIVYPENVSSSNLTTALRRHCADRCGAIESLAYSRKPFDAEALVSNLSKAPKNILVFLGTDSEALSLMNEMEKLNWRPLVCLPGGAGKDLFEAPTSFKQKLFVSLAFSPTDQDASAIADYRDLASKYKLPQNNMASQLLVLSAAKILVEGMKRSGKDLTTDSLINSLESLKEFSTGLTPRVSYGPNRRLGAMGAYVVMIDLEQRTLVPIGGWRTIDAPPSP